MERSRFLAAGTFEVVHSSRFNVEVERSSQDYYPHRSFHISLGGGRSLPCSKKPESSNKIFLHSQSLEKKEHQPRWSQAQYSNYLESTVGTIHSTYSIP